MQNLLSLLASMNWDTFIVYCCHRKKKQSWEESSEYCKYCVETFKIFLLDRGD